MAKTAAVLLALAASVMASPAGSPLEARETLAPVATPIGTAIGGAMDPVTTSRAVEHGALLAAGPEYLTMSLSNACGWPILTSHASNAGCPTAVAGSTAAGTIAVGEVGVLVVPTNYAGNIGTLASLEYATEY
jgi:hypothetical protein